MNTDYSDILALSPTKPLWWDENGVPRYIAFSPGRCGVYTKHVALVKIGCQSCDREWLVASADRSHGESISLPSAQQDCWDSIGSFHYGDPPRHDCVGDTMNSTPIRVCEFWALAKPSYEWTRMPEHEVDCEPIARATLTT